MPRKKMLPAGIRLHGAGYQTFAKVGSVQMPRKSWPIDTPFEVMTDSIRDWKKSQHGSQDGGAGFAADIDAYCQQKAALSSIDLRRQHLEFIAAKIGADRSRHTIGFEELNTVFANLENDGAAISTIHNYRASIRAFFNVMDPDRVNPVKKTAIPAKPEGGAKGRRIEIIEAILAQLTNRGKARHRIRVMAKTGIPPALLKKVKPTDLRPNPEAPVEVQIAPRRKGKGVAARTLPLTEEGSQAFAAFHRANAYGSFATTGINTAFQLAASKVPGVGDISVYALRHSFLSDLYRVTRDQATVADFAMHAPGSPLTAQYCRAAREEVNAAAVVAFNAWRAKARAIAAGQAAAEATQAAPVGIPAAIIEAARLAAAAAFEAAIKAAMEAAPVAASAGLQEAA